MVRSIFLFEIRILFRMLTFANYDLIYKFKKIYLTRREMFDFDTFVKCF